MKKQTSLNKVSTIFGVVLCLIFIPLIIVNLTLIIQSYTNPENLPGIFGIKPAVVLSGSMDPTIETGDLIFIKNVQNDALKEGDVICYMNAGKAVTHRIVDITVTDSGDKQYITQGDANNAKDMQPVLEKQIQGIWDGSRMKGLGNIILFMQTTTGMILFIIGPLLLFIIWNVWHRHKLDRMSASHTAELEAELEALKKEKSVKE